MQSRSAPPFSLISLRVLGESQCYSESESIPAISHNRSSRSITESSLFFTTGDFCSRLSEQYDELAEPHHLVKFQEGIERRLEGRAIYRRE